MAEPSTAEKYCQMQDVLRTLRKVAVAFSAGVDSTFLLTAAVDTLGADNVLAITGKSDSLIREEFEECRRVTAELGVAHVVIDTDELSNPAYARNAPDRCYHCKSTLFDQAAAYLQEHSFPHVILAGTNADDLGDWRPGIRAASERGVRSPAAEVGLTKSDIRTLSGEWGLPTSDKPASPCLASRIAYGEEVTAEKLQVIADAERFLRELGLREFRVRHHGNLARIEVPPDRIAELAQPEFRESIDRRLRELGFTFVALDLRGFRSGSLNEVITLTTPRQQ
ncbi:MAG: ATP-dependent sacrificial sulfur transferase LarE [bacterium]|nr:ATP-dependent sacrificial sulfur transferase LarE [bacterium]